MSRMALVGKGQLSVGQEQDGRSEVKEGFKDAWASLGALWFSPRAEDPAPGLFGGSWGLAGGEHSSGLAVPSFVTYSSVY